MKGTLNVTIEQFRGIGQNVYIELLATAGNARIFVLERPADPRWPVRAVVFEPRVGREIALDGYLDQSGSIDWKVATECEDFKSRIRMPLPDALARVGVVLDWLLEQFYLRLAPGQYTIADPPRIDTSEVVRRNPSPAAVVHVRGPDLNRTYYVASTPRLYVDAAVGRFDDNHGIGYVDIKVWIDGPVYVSGTSRRRTPDMRLYGDTPGSAPFSWTVVAPNARYSPLRQLGAPMFRDHDATIEKYGPFLDWLVSLDELGLRSADPWSYVEYDVSGNPPPLWVFDE